jgi:magnesium-transporting ATPase (P-type)
LITAAAKADLNQAGMTSLMPRLDSIPFESEYQYMATLHDALPRVIYVKGSVEALLQRCTHTMAESGQLIPLDTISYRAGGGGPSLQKDCGYWPLPERLSATTTTPSTTTTFSLTWCSWACRA